jgi:hypothetical protein
MPRVTMARKRLIRQTMPRLPPKSRRATATLDAGKPGECHQNLGTLRCILKGKSHI